MIRQAMWERRTGACAGIKGPESRLLHTATDGRMRGVGLSRALAPALPAGASRPATDDLRWPGCAIISVQASWGRHRYWYDAPAWPALSFGASRIRRCLICGATTNGYRLTGDSLGQKFKKSPCLKPMYLYLPETRLRYRASDRVIF